MLLVSPNAHLRQACAVDWLQERGHFSRCTVVGPSLAAADDVVRRWVGGSNKAVFGVERASLSLLASQLARPALARAGIAAAGPLVIQAVVAHILHQIEARSLGALEGLVGKPGLPAALARTLSELRCAGVTREHFDQAEVHADIDRAHLSAVALLLERYEAALVELRLADRADVMRLATRAVAERPICNVVLTSASLEDLGEERFVRALLFAAPSWFASVAPWQCRELAVLEGLASDVVHKVDDTPLARWQASIFESRSNEDHLGVLGDELEVLSAPGESREAAEIARRVLRAAEAGVPFDRMAVLVRSWSHFRPHLVEAFRRANVPTYFAEGATLPDPGGRALLALLGCAVEGLSARAFAEYLSLGQVPVLTADGAPPNAPEAADRWILQDSEFVHVAQEVQQLDDTDLPDDGTLPAPWRWEELLVDAAVIGGIDRWQRRIDGLKASLKLEAARLADESPERASAAARRLDELGHLERFALPLLENLAALPAEATWGAWCSALAELATRALRHPARVLATLAELAPMGDVGPVVLDEVRTVLRKRLLELQIAPKERRDGRLYVGTILRSRGLSFDVVFVPGLAEKVFPERVSQDPLLSDDLRRALAPGLVVNDDRSARERALLREGLGAAVKKVVVSYSRFDAESARARTPSFYALEVLGAAKCRPVSYEELADVAQAAGQTRLGFPAPRDASQAIDETEHDLATLARIFELPENQSAGMAAYLLAGSEHLGRALRSRARRWKPRFSGADGLVDPSPSARAVLEKHQLAARSYSPTALQNYASCPYRFYLQAILRFQVREAPAALEELDPLQRGSLIHDIQFDLHTELRRRGWLPINEGNVEQVDKILDETIERVASRYYDELCPAIDRVWLDALRFIRADMREWLRLAAEPSPWVPAFFELSFGLETQDARDAQSRDEAIALDCGVKLRGSIDLVERHAQTGALRASDYKTGKAWVKDNVIIGGGKTLQPVFYALTLEKLFPRSEVIGGRLYYATFTGRYQSVLVPLSDKARASARAIVAAVDGALKEGFLPAYPDEHGCSRCDFLAVCGPYEEMRSQKKRPERVHALRVLREMP
jgi:RecB family exonuclease